MLEDFLALSRILTGVEKIWPTLAPVPVSADKHLVRTFLRQILKLFHGLKKDKSLPDKVKSQIVGNDTVRPAICQIILLWYTSAMQDNPDTPTVFRYGTQEEFFSGLAWSIVGAHVPGLSGGYFGHWRYRPDNEPWEDA
jgi:hypothetical protein